MPTHTGRLETQNIWIRECKNRWMNKFKSLFIFYNSLMVCTNLAHTSHCESYPQLHDEWIDSVVRFKILLYPARTLYRPLLTRFTEHLPSGISL